MRSLGTAPAVAPACARRCSRAVAVVHLVAQLAGAHDVARRDPGAAHAAARGGAVAARRPRPGRLAGAHARRARAVLARRQRPAADERGRRVPRHGRLLPARPGRLHRGLLAVSATQRAARAPAPAARATSQRWPALVAACVGGARGCSCRCSSTARCLGTMAVLATGVNRLTAVGGALFLVSDGLIALDAFVPAASTCRARASGSWRPTSPPRPSSSRGVLREQTPARDAPPRRRMPSALGERTASGGCVSGLRGRGRGR